MHELALIGENFLNGTASQLTYHGLCELNTAVTEEELCVFFRNNHFSTLYKHKVSIREVTKEWRSIALKMPVCV